MIEFYLNRPNKKSNGKSISMCFVIVSGENPWFDNPDAMEVNLQVLG